MNVRWLAALMLLGLLPMPVQAADRRPRTVSVWYDARLSPSPLSRFDQLDELEAGDTLIINVDRSRLFPRHAVQGPGFATGTSIPPELTSFYVASYMMVGQKLTYTSSAGVDVLSLSCDETVDQLDGEWSVLSNTSTEMAVYRCPTLLPDVGAHLGALPRYGKWKIKTGTTTVANLRTATAAPALERVVARTSLDGGPDEARTAEVVDGVHRVKIPLVAGRVAIELEMSREGRLERRRIDAFDVVEPDDHSLIRIQAELAVTNEGRSFGFAVAATPVMRHFFTGDGPWRDSSCHLLCVVSPTVLLRVAGDDGRTTAQLGLGLGVFINRAFQLNTGLMFGTEHVSVPWVFEENWFVGIGVDPFILAEMLNTKVGGTKP